MKTDNDEIPERSPQNKFRIGDEASLREKITARLRESPSGSFAQFNRYEKEDFEKRIALDFAKEHHVWITNLYSLGLPLSGGGNENTLAINLETGALYKSNNLFNSNFLISNLLDQIKIHNSLFPETKYEFIGFTGIDHGENKTPYIEVVLKQEYIPDLTQASPKEINIYMKSLGFDKIDDTTFVNENHKISDLYPRNVLKDKNGTIYVVDNIIHV